MSTAFLLLLLLVDPPTSKPTTQPQTTFDLYKAAADAAVPALDAVLEDDVAEELEVADCSTVAAHAAVKEYIVSSRRSYELLKSATARSHCVLPSLLEELQGGEEIPWGVFRKASNPIKWRLLYHAGRNEWDRYDEVAWVGHRVALHLEGQGLIASLIANALMGIFLEVDQRVIRSQPPATVLQQIGSRLAELDKLRPPVAAWFTGEAEYMKAALEQEYAKSLDGAALLEELPPEVAATVGAVGDPKKMVEQMTSSVTMQVFEFLQAVPKSLVGPDTWVEALAQLDALEARSCATDGEADALMAKIEGLKRQVEALDPADHAALQPLLDEMAQHISTTVSRLLARLYMGTAKLMPRRYTAFRAKLQLHQIACALGQHYHEQGTLPQKLEELQLSPQLAKDPFDGKPLRYQSTANGYLLWSCGRDLEDAPEGDPDDIDDIQFLFTIPGSKPGQ